jgi:hypothetical protein
MRWSRALLALALVSLPALVPFADADTPFALAGETTFRSSGSMAGRFVVEHNMSLAEMELVSGTADSRGLQFVGRLLPGSSFSINAFTCICHSVYM